MPRQIKPELGYEPAVRPVTVRHEKTGRRGTLIGWHISPSGHRIGADVAERTTFLGPCTILPDEAEA